MALRTQTLVIPEDDATATSSSIDIEHLDLIGLVVPAMETDTVYLLFESTSERNAAVADASCTWDPIFDGTTGARLACPVTAGVAQRVELDPSVAHLLGRFRVVAVNGSLVAVTQTAAKTLAPVLRDLS